MAIVNYLGGGGYINTGQGTQATAQLSGQQAAQSQQSLQQRRMEMQNYLEQLPILAQQMGYRPEEINQFIKQQEMGVKNALAILGVPDVEGTFQGMINETTAGQRLAGGAIRVADDVTAQRQADMPQGLTGQQREEYLTFGTQPTTSVENVTRQVPVQVPATEPTQVSLSGADYAESFATGERRISNADVPNMRKMAEYLAANAVTDQAKAEANRLLIRLNSGARDIKDDEFTAMTNAYLNDVKQGMKVDTVNSFVEPGSKFTIPQGANAIAVEQISGPINISKLYRDDGTIAPAAQEIINTYTTDSEKQEFINSLVNSNVPAEGYKYEVAKMFMQEQKENVVQQVQTKTMEDIAVELRDNPEMKQEFQTVIEQVQKTTPGVQGWLTAVEQFRQKAEQTSPGAGEFVLPKLDQQQQAAQINYLNAQSENLRRQGDTVEAAIMAELQKALIEQDTELFKTNLGQYYDLLSKAFDEQLAGVKDSDKTEFINQFMQNFVTNLGFSGLGAQISNGEITKELFNKWRGTSTVLPGAAFRQQGNGVSSGEALNTLSSQLR